MSITERATRTPRREPGGPLATGPRADAAPLRGPAGRLGEWVDGRDQNTARGTGPSATATEITGMLSADGSTRHGWDTGARTDQRLPRRHAVDRGHEAPNANPAQGDHDGEPTHGGEPPPSSTASTATRPRTDVRHILGEPGRRRGCDRHSSWTSCFRSPRCRPPPGREGVLVCSSWPCTCTPTLSVELSSSCSPPRCCLSSGEARLLSAGHGRIRNSLWLPPVAFQVDCCEETRLPLVMIAGVLAHADGHVVAGRVCAGGRMRTTTPLAPARRRPRRRSSRAGPPLRAAIVQSANCFR